MKSLQESLLDNEDQLLKSTGDDAIKDLQMKWIKENEKGLENWGADVKQCTFKNKLIVTPKWFELEFDSLSAHFLKLPFPKYIQFKNIYQITINCNNGGMWGDLDKDHSLLPDIGTVTRLLYYPREGSCADLEFPTIKKINSLHIETPRYSKIDHDIKINKNLKNLTISGNVSAKELYHFKNLKLDTLTFYGYCLGIDLIEWKGSSQRAKPSIIKDEEAQKAFNFLVKNNNIKRILFKPDEGESRLYELEELKSKSKQGTYKIVQTDY